MNKNKFDQMLRQINSDIEPSRLVGLETRVWESLHDQAEVPLFGALLVWRSATLALVLLIGGWVGAGAQSSAYEGSLGAFSSAPAYSIMQLVNS